LIKDQIWNVTSWSVSSSIGHDNIAADEAGGMPNIGVANTTRGNGSMSADTLAHRNNLFAGLRCPTTGEVFDELLRCRNLRIERIVSSPTPEPTLYDQPQDEWVLLIQGAASLEIFSEHVDLAAGDYLFIPAHTPHRVVATSAEPHCVWLAVHLDPESNA
jgi:cupin 2 domain-containing protein